jgi:hypothetical protein
MRKFLLLLLFSFPFASTAADWPQWRGPNRDGVAPDSPPLIDKIPEAGLPELWESEMIPSNDDGGLSTPVVAGGKVFVALPWHRQEPTETRQIETPSVTVGNAQ